MTHALLKQRNIRREVNLTRNGLEHMMLLDEMDGLMITRGCQT